MSSKIVSWNTQQTLSESASRPYCIRKIQDRHITTDIRNIPDNKCTLLFVREARKQQSKVSLVKKSGQVRIILKIKSQSKAPKQTLYEMVAEEPSLFWFLMQSSNPVEFWQIHLPTCLEFTGQGFGSGRAGLQGWPGEARGCPVPDTAGSSRPPVRHSCALQPHWWCLWENVF